MKINAEFIELDNVTTPDLNEPKGKEYFDAYMKIRSKVNEKRQEQSDARKKRDKLDKQLQAIKEKIVLSDDPNKAHKYAEQVSEIKRKQEYYKTLLKFDIDKYHKRLINEDEFLQLENQANKEYSKKRQQAKEYLNELTKQYEAITKDINRFIADYQSDAYTGKTRTRKAMYK